MSFLELVVNSFPVLLAGLRITLLLTLASVVLAVVIGAPIAVMRTSAIAPLRWVAHGYIAVVRGVPLIALMFVIYFGIVSVLRVDAFTAGALGLGIHTSAYVAEIFRSGFLAVPRGQTEAARSIGMSRVVTVRRVVGPQAIRVVIPALANQMIITLKDSAVASFITVDELFLRAQRLSAANFQPLAFYVIVSVYYLIVVGLMTLGANRMERAFSKGHVR
jgi:His/Glu/Gln/Arg/opine family amino acid ABC transporter permease subunit